MNNNYNNISFDYIGAIGTHTITDYIDINSNILNDKIDIRSNILNNKIDTTSNILKLYTDTNITNLDNKYKKLISEKIEISPDIENYNITNTWITNSNIDGEIIFYVKQSGIFDPLNASGQLYRTKIDGDGKLYLYYNYNAAIGLLETERWIDPVNMLIAHNVALGNIGAILGGTDIATSTLLFRINKNTIDIQELQALLLTDNIIRPEDAVILRDTNSTYGQLKIAYENIKFYISSAQNFFNRINVIYAGIVGSITFNIIFAIYNAIQAKVRSDYLINNLNYHLSSNVAMTEEEKEELIDISFKEYTSNLNDISVSLSNISLNQGFINSNILFAQNYINSNTVADLYLLKTGNINLNQVNNWITTQYGTYYDITDGTLAINATPTQEDFLKVGGQTTIQGELRCENKIKENNLYLSDVYATINNLNITSNTLNTKIDTNLNSSSNYTFNTSNILNTKIDTNINITSNSLNTNTSNLLYDTNYTTERPYPPKAYNSFTTEITSSGEILNVKPLNYVKETITLNIDGITYGSGTYIIYSSATTNDVERTKAKLFNYTYLSVVGDRGAYWGYNNYTRSTGLQRNNNYIKSDYFGEWSIIKFPFPFILTKYIIYGDVLFTERRPSLWRFYGSNDGINWYDITDAEVNTPLILSDYSSNKYEKTLNISFNTPYQYIGITFNKIIGNPDGTGNTHLAIPEIELWGKEFFNYTPIYTTPNAVKSLVRNEMPDIPKRKVFIVSIPSSSTFFDATVNTTFYKWDLDLTKYTTTQLITSDPPTGDLLRNFKISFWYVPSYFGSYLNAEPYVVSYTVFMSNKSNPVFGKPETAGVNIYAVGFPENIKLNNILPNNLMLLKNYFGNFNYLTIVSRNAPADIYVVIEDQLF